MSLYIDIIRKSLSAGGAPVCLVGADFAGTNLFP